MAKLPTFQASKVSGGSAMVQAPTLQRSMARSFKKSTNIKASDIYDSTGDQALIGALNTGISYYNKVQVQKDNALFEQRKTELESDLSRLELELEQKGVDADTHASQFVKQGSDRYKSGLSKQNQANFDNYFARRSVGIAANATTITSNTVKQSYFDNGKLINERNKLGIANGSKDPEQALTEINEHITLGVKDNYFSPESGQSQSEAAIKEYKFTDNKASISEVDSIESAKFVEEQIEADSEFMGADNTISLKNALEQRRKSIKIENFYNGQQKHHQFLQRIRNGSATPDEVNDYKSWLSSNVSERVAFDLSNEIDTQVLIKDATELKLNHPGADWSAIKKMLLVQKDRTKSAVDKLDIFISGIEKGAEEYNAKMVEAELNYTLAPKSFEARLNPNKPVDLITGLSEEIKNDPSMFNKVKARQEELEKERVNNPLGFWLDHPDNI